MPTPEEIIADVHGDTGAGCAGPIGGGLASRIVAALKDAGWVILARSEAAVPYVAEPKTDYQPRTVSKPPEPDRETDPERVPAARFRAPNKPSKTTRWK